MTIDFNTIVRHLSVSQISDAMDELGLPSNACGGFQMLGGTATVAGRAFTLKQVKRDRDNQDRPLLQGKVASSLALRGQVLVIDAGDISNVATWGAAHTLRAKSNGLAGVVIQGATRDAATIGECKLPILYRHTSPVRSLKRLVTAEVGGQIRLGDVYVNSSDLIVFDHDGIVAMTPNVENEVIKMAMYIANKEKERDQDLKLQSR